MMQKIKMICFGARKNEQTYFSQLNKYGYELTLVEALLTEDNVDLIKGHNAVMLRGNCNAKAKNLAAMKTMGVEFLLTRTVGFDHIDVPEAKRLGFKLARVPGYSPNAISELTLTLAMMLLRHTAAMTNATRQADFTVHGNYFSREVRLLKVGVFGVGRIGLTTAKLFKGLGAEVLGYDVYQSDAAKEVVEFRELDDVIANADILCIHMPYFKGQNDHFVNHAFISKMKDNAILVNCGRGELVDVVAVIDGIKAGKIDGYGADVLENESAIFNHNFNQQSTGNAVVDELVSLYPRVLLTPHVGSNTDEACRNMIEYTYDNLNEFLTTGSSKNEL
ncbi:NAD(P)-dependent oxidoreductase [Utexia brackfieldae]|uniref:NAD(P)-dependent oxidoreductase n=1 Tax=Utexia brackfieldae TaxID=3074108 RepID=UPI00370D513F